MNKWTYATVCALMALASFGCNQPEGIATKPIPVVESPENGTSHSVAVANIDAQSPATEVDLLPKKDASPSDVCEAFVKYLNNGESTNVELLLTPTALTVTSRQEFQIPPIGDLNTKCKFAEPQFGTKKQKLCYIECQTSDVDGADATITWMMRATRRGWRVAGMMVEDTSNDSMNLISFENSKDVQQVKAELDSEAP